ncbi:MAG TPA: hypothetical protein VGR03_06775 [Candidatus Acidoferrum sp.]|nr:hypothetical protein [Candidatus Acidoferrum sp.]
MATTTWVAGLYADLFAYKNADARATTQQLEEEQSRAALVPALPRMEWDETFRWQGYCDARVSVLALEQETGLLPVLPRPSRDEVEWQRWFGSQFQNQTQEIDSGLFPILPLRAWEEPEWQKWADSRIQQITSEQDTGLLPIISLPPPTLGWDDWDWNKNFTEKRLWFESEALVGAPFLPSTSWLEESAAAFAGSSGSLAAMVMMDDFVNAPSGGTTFGPAPRGRSVRLGFSISAFR